MLKRTLLFTLLVLSLSASTAQVNSDHYLFKENVSYISKEDTDAYKTARCKLDVYYPSHVKDFTTVVWFHGGGLEGGEKSIPEALKGKGIAVVAVNYRLSPMANHPAYIEDAAQSVAWVFNTIESMGGNPQRIYVAGHSAGGYLALMIGLDKSYLNKYGIDANRIKGLIPISGQTNTHYTIKKERGLPFEIPFVDRYAPLNHVRKDAPPTLLITGDRTLELAARYEENAHLEAVLRAVGNTGVTLYQLQGFDHGNVDTPGCYLMLNWILK